MTDTVSDSERDDFFRKNFGITEEDKPFKEHRKTQAATSSRSTANPSVRRPNTAPEASPACHDPGTGHQTKPQHGSTRSSTAAGPKIEQSIRVWCALRGERRRCSSEPVAVPHPEPIQMLCVAGHRHRGKTCPICRRSGASRPELNRYAWQRLRAKVRARDGNCCRNCGATEKLSVHHIQRGGPDTWENLVTLCSRCHAHAERHAKTLR
jgi:5-methylcytosine-specific restriction endonuclease McrA